MTAAACAVACSSNSRADRLVSQSSCACPITTTATGTSANAQPASLPTSLATIAYPLLYTSIALLRAPRIAYNCLSVFEAIGSAVCSSRAQYGSFNRRYRILKKEERAGQKGAGMRHHNLTVLTSVPIVDKSSMSEFNVLI